MEVDQRQALAGFLSSCSLSVDVELRASRFWHRVLEPLDFSGLAMFVRGERCGSNRVYID